MKDYNLKLSVRNNKILSMMKIYEISNNAELSKLTGLSPSTIGNMVNLKDSGLNGSGRIRSQYKRLAVFFKVLPEDIIPEAQMTDGLEYNSCNVEVNLNEMLSLTGKEAELIEYKSEDCKDVVNIADNLLSTLTNRESSIVKMTFGIDCDKKTMSEIGSILNITRNRVKQIADRAIWKIRNIAIKNGDLNTILEALNTQKSLN